MFLERPWLNPKSPETGTVVQQVARLLWCSPAINGHPAPEQRVDTQIGQRGRFPFGGRLARVDGAKPIPRTPPNTFTVLPSRASRSCSSRSPGSPSGRSCRGSLRSLNGPRRFKETARPRRARRTPRTGRTHTDAEPNGRAVHPRRHGEQIPCQAMPQRTREVRKTRSATNCGGGSRPCSASSNVSALISAVVDNVCRCVG